MTEPYRLRYTNQAVGSFLLVILLVLIGLSVWVMRAGDYFVEQDSYWIEISQEEIRDLYKGAEVMILGERAGVIDNIRYVDDSEMVRVTLSIDPKMSGQIFEDSVVRQERKFGLGTPILVIRRASRADPLGPTESNREPLRPGNRLGVYQGESDRIDQVTRQVESVSESIRLIQERLDPTLVSIGAATDQLRSTLQSHAGPALAQSELAASSFIETNEQLRPKTMETLQTIQSATSNLEAKVGVLTDQMTEMVDVDVRKTLNEVRQSNESVRAAADSIAQTSTDVNKDIAHTLSTLREAAEQVRELAVQTQQLVQVVRGEADQLPGTAERVNETVSDAQDMVGEIRSHWLLRRYSRQGQPSTQVSPARVRSSLPMVPGGSVRP